MEQSYGSGGAGDGSATEQAREKAAEVAGQAREQAGGKLREQVDQRSTQAGEQVSGTAEALRTTSEQLRSQGKDGPAQAAERAAQQAEKLGGYLTQSDADRILHDVEDYGRRNPWAVVAGGLALGFAASRFLRASSRQRYQQSSGGGRGPEGRFTDGRPQVSAGGVPPVGGTVTSPHDLPTAHPAPGPGAPRVPSGIGEG